MMQAVEAVETEWPEAETCSIIKCDNFIIDTPINAPLVYYTVISLQVSTLPGHHQGYTQNTKS
jgi:hypothetical protein